MIWRIETIWLCLIFNLWWFYPSHNCTTTWTGSSIDYYRIVSFAAHYRLTYWLYAWYVQSKHANMRHNTKKKSCQKWYWSAARKTWNTQKFDSNSGQTESVVVFFSEGRDTSSRLTGFVRLLNQAQVTKQ